MTLLFSIYKNVKSSIFIKQLVLLILLFTTPVSFSQAKSSMEFIDKFEEFDYYAKPDKTNKLSAYFRSEMDTRLLKAVKFKQPDARKQRVFLSFQLNSKNEPIAIKVTSPYSELNNNIIVAFKKYDIEKLNIPEINPKNTYLLQIISKANDKIIVNCSTTIIYDRFPVFEGCESVVSYNRMKTCINKQLEKHIVKNMSPDEIIKAKVFGYIMLHPRFIVDKKGGIKQIKSKAPSVNLTNELNRIVALFPKAKIPPTRNGNPTNLYYDGYVGLQIGSKDEKYEDEVLKSKDTTLKGNNSLALHFKKYITEKELKNIAFFRKQQHIKISFGINKKGKLIEVKTNLRNIKMNNKLVQIFKKFPFEKLNIVPSNILTLYSYNIITKSASKNVIQCNDEPLTSIFPIFNKKCEKSKSPGVLKKCFSENITRFLVKNFDSKLRNKTKLKGEIKIYAMFQVDTLGNIAIIKVRAPNPFLSNEIGEIINSIPKVYKPGLSNGEVVKTKIGAPVRFRIGSERHESAPKAFRTRQY